MVIISKKWNKFKGTCVEDELAGSRWSWLAAGGRRRHRLVYVLRIAYSHVARNWRVAAATAQTQVAAVLPPTLRRHPSAPAAPTPAAAAATAPAATSPAAPATVIVPAAIAPAELAGSRWELVASRTAAELAASRSTGWQPPAVLSREYWGQAGPDMDRACEAAVLSRE